MALPNIGQNLIKSFVATRLFGRANLEFFVNFLMLSESEQEEQVKTWGEGYRQVLETQKVEAELVVATLEKQISEVGIK